MGDFLGPKNPTTEKYILKQLLKKNESGQIEKSQQGFFGKKEGERISVIRKTVIDDAENLGLVPVLEPF